MSDRLSAMGLVEKFRETLAAWRDRSTDSEVSMQQWSKSWSVRTHLMKGNAVKTPPHQKASPNHILRDVLEALGYSRAWQGNLNQRRVYFHERHGLDIVALECPSNWDDDCWRGLYRTTLAIEVENDPQEFAMTMRSLLDVRTPLSCGVFYTDQDSPQQIEVGVSNRGATRVPLQRFVEWTPPWFEGPWSVSPLPEERQLALVLSTKEPRIVTARSYRAGGEVEVLV